MPKTLIIDNDPAFEQAVQAHFGGEAMRESFIFAHDKGEALAVMSARDDIDLAAV
ncbi:MAG: hypothetical protein HUJ11_06870, partial [Arenibacter algicola]|nr:hypothetical protein [Arenibacter algicola]